MSSQNGWAKYGDALEFARKALDAHEHVKVTAPNPRIAENIRMRFYQRREQLRDGGDTTFDVISVKLQGKEVYFFRNDVPETEIKVEVV